MAFLHRKDGGSADVPINGCLSDSRAAGAGAGAQVMKVTFLHSPAAEADGVWHCSAILARRDLLTRLFSRWLAFQRRREICFSLWARGIDCDRLALVRPVWLARGGDNCRVLLSEELYLIQSRLSAWRRSHGVSLVWGSLGHTFTPHCGCRFLWGWLPVYTLARLAPCSILIMEGQFFTYFHEHLHGGRQEVDV